jgi:LysM repeat protein
MTKIKSLHLFFTLFLVFSVFSCVLRGQSKSADIKNINGKKYYIHKVEKGQSLYAIAKIYGIDINSILAENDDAIDGIKHGQELKVPFESLLSKQVEVPSIDTNKYIYHKIIKGETVYGITKKYAIDEKKLTFYNPKIVSGIKEGDYIIVGEKKKSIVGKANTSAIATNSIISNDTYTVLQGETLYGISKKVNISQEDLLNLNPEINSGLRPGQILKTNIKNKVVQSNDPVAIQSATSNVVNTISTDSIVFNKNKKSKYEIGLFLPFEFTESENIDIDELIKSKSSFPQAQSLSLDFYFGLKTAIDSLKANDFDVNIHLFDTEERDSARIEMICKTEEFKTLDVIFGPLFSGVFKQMSQHAKNFGIPIVSPVIHNNKILFKNQFVSKVTPSVFTLIEGLADYCIDSLSATSNVILVNTSKKEQSYSKAFKSRYIDGLTKKNKLAAGNIIEVNNMAELKTVYVAGKKNVVVALSNNQAYLQDFITQLYMFSDKKDITFFGFSGVSNIDNFDQEYLNALHFHFASPNHIDFKDSTIRVLTKIYQDVYFADPSDEYFQAFDIGTYYLSNLKKQGPEFFLNLDNNSWEGASTGFKFYRPDKETGFENRAIYIYKYSNYQLEKLGWK